MAPSPSVRWPAEWAPHAGTWLAWPHNLDTWPRNLPAAQQEFVRLARTIAEVEQVWLVCPAESLDDAQRRVGTAANIQWIELPTDDAWIRDSGPTFVRRDDETEVVDWTYNAWGGKYPPYDRDAALARRIAERLGLARHPHSAVVEGGSIEGNGEGLLLTTRSCLLHPNRNGADAAPMLTEGFRELLGADEVWWLSGGDMAGDDTDGHIDQLARFVSVDTLVVAQRPSVTDENYPLLRGLREELHALAAQSERRVATVDLPMPGAVTFQGVRLPASYANFYICNELLVLPQFGDPADARAQAILEEVQERPVVALPSRNLTVGLGSFHCLTQQQPAAAEG